jgi:hypothetical protein
VRAKLQTLILVLATAAITTAFTVNMERVLEAAGLDRVLLSASPLILNLVTSPYFPPVAAFAAGVAVVLVSQHFRKPKSETQTSDALTIDINLFDFMSESRNRKGTYRLYLNIKAQKTVAITRITVVFNRSGGNGSYELISYPVARQMHHGEKIELVLMHYRPNVGTFWGDVDPVTERPTLDHLIQDEREAYMKRSLHHDGPYYCQLIVQHAPGEERMNFTVLIPPSPERPTVLTDRYHKNYDPNRLIPARGTFVS